MSARAFVDTNILVYAVDIANPVKQERAQSLLAFEVDLELVLSAQVLGEFYVTVTRKLAAPLSSALASEAVVKLSTLVTVPIDGQLVRAAIATSQASQLSYWDALIVETAAASGCDRLLTEDLADGSTIRGVRITNPFAAG